MMAARLAQKLPAQISYDEICSAGYDGLLEAVQAYDPSHKAKFETFCQQRIHGAVMDWLRTLDGQSRTVRSFEKQRMLLGHRYLTDTQMPIAPLRRLTHIYLANFAARVIWTLVHALPVWTTDFQPTESPLFFQLVLYTRLGVGLFVAAVFAYMSTSATGTIHD